MDKSTIFPINRLNQRVTEKLSSIISADILGNINKGLKSKIKLADQGTNITDIARAANDTLEGGAYVTISAAFMQYVWPITDTALKKVDLAIIRNEFAKYGVDYRLYPTMVDLISLMPKDEIVRLGNTSKDFDVDKYIDYLKRSKPLFETELHERKISMNDSLMSRLTTQGEVFSEADFAEIDLNGKYEEVINSAYTYSIVFVALHELSHFALGHLDMTPEQEGNETEAERKEDEHDADMSAFWAVYSDLEGGEQFTAIIGIFCLLFALLMLNHTLEEDHEHPREDKRIFDIYDQVRGDNPKYTVLLVRMFNMWATKWNIKGFPEITDDSESSLDSIRVFLDSYVTDKSC